MKKTIAAAIALIVAFGLAGCDMTTLPDLKSASGSSNSANAATTTDQALRHDLNIDRPEAEKRLAAMTVRNFGMQGYSRDKQFGNWLDADSNGWTMPLPSPRCNSREATLIRDGENVVADPKTCSVKSGRWIDPLTGTVMTNAREEIEIDHVVPLANAYRSGASNWDNTQRRKYANDPEVLAISLGTENGEMKGDSGPEVYKPVESSRCAYALRWVQIKSKYQLTLNSENERAALTQMLGTC